MKLFKKVAFYVVHHVDPVLKAIPRYAIPYETYLYGTKFGDFWKKSPYFRTSKIVTAISISHTLIFYVIGLNRANSR